MKAIAFSGTFDPITNGHMWVIGEARAVADEVVVLISENPDKNPVFTASQRKSIIEASVADCGWENVRVDIIRGDYTARAAKRAGIDYLIRGIRNTADFDYENLIQQTNVDVLNGAKTLFVMPPRDLGSVSSSFLKSLQGPVGWHWSIRSFVPRPAYDAWIRTWLRQEWESLWEGADQGVAGQWYDFLIGERAYGATGRHYHNLDHLVHGLSELRAWGATVGAAPHDIALLKKAFWFHDAVYEHGQQAISNEEASARLWLKSGLDKNDGDSVATLIRTTDHFQGTSLDHALKDVMLGADLAILGQDTHVYDTYALGIRQEYARVPEQTYREHRSRAVAVLSQKAREGQLFGDQYFSAQYTGRAMANLNREMMSLQ
jgi:pantetheine-phosphate adenylyltransferase